MNGIGQGCRIEQSDSPVFTDSLSNLFWAMKGEKQKGYCKIEKRAGTQLKSGKRMDL